MIQRCLAIFTRSLSLVAGGSVESHTLLRRSESLAHISGRYNRQGTGKLDVQLLTDKLTATRQLSCLPNVAKQIPPPFSSVPGITTSSVQLPTEVSFRQYIAILRKQARSPLTELCAACFTTDAKEVGKLFDGRK